MIRPVLAAAAVATYLVTTASAGTIVTDRGSVEQSRTLFSERASTPFISPLDLVTYGNFPYDIEREFMLHRLETCSTVAQQVEQYRAAVGRVSHEDIGARYDELREHKIPADCIITVVGDDVEWNETIVHLVVLSTDGDWIFTAQGNIPYQQVGMTTFRYYEMSVPFEPLMYIGVKE